MDKIGFFPSSSTHALTTRLSLLDISASPRCTALKSRSALASSSPPAFEDAAPPPMPMRYAGPPILTTSMPMSPSVFSRFE